METQYILSYEYKSNINSEDNLKTNYINASELLIELRNYAFNIASFHSIMSLLLYLIRILYKFDNSLRINKKLLSEPIFTPINPSIIQMYKCTTLTNK
jgi:hypothetical protein